MAMPFAVAVETSLRKYRRKKLRIFFGIAPTVFLFVFIVLLSGLVISLDNFVNTRILAKLEHKEEIFELSRAGGMASGPPPSVDPRSDADDPTAYTSDDLAKIKAVEHVVEVQAERPLPNMLIVTKDLVESKELQLTSLVGAPSHLGRLYGTEDFEYRSGQPIPIIINRSTFNYQHLDFGDKSDVVISDKDFSSPAKAQDLNPHKATFLKDDYNRQKLLNKTFTATLGGLPRAPSYTSKFSFQSGNTSQSFHKLTAAEQEVEVKKQRDKISPYWDYDVLQKGVTLQFKIVGFSENLENQAQFIPLEAGSEIIQRLYSLQRSARNGTPLPEDAYGNTFGGLRLSKTGQLSSGSGFSEAPLSLISARHITDGGHAEIAPEVMPIPGWIYQFAIKDNTTVPLEVTNFNLKPEALAIKAVAVKIDDAGNREKVQKALSANGYPEAEASFSFTNMLRGIRRGINSALFWIVAILTAINSLILISTVSRSVAEAQREIGVYRALGARKQDIRKLYVVYSALQTTIGIGAGLLMGLLLIYPLSRFLAGKVTDFLPTDNTGGFMGFDLRVSAADLQGIDWQKILLYSAALLLVTVVVSLLPAARASRISPVEAIRRAD
jgi:hypothetical protein